METDCAQCLVVQSTGFLIMWMLVDRFGPLISPKTRHFHIVHTILFESLLLFYPISGVFGTKLLIRLAFAYFAYDLYVILFLIKPQVNVILQDLFLMVLLFWCATTGTDLGFIFLLVFCVELCSVTDKIRKLIESLGYYDTTGCGIIEILYFLFIVARCVVIVVWVEKRRGDNSIPGYVEWLIRLSMILAVYLGFWIITKMMRGPKNKNN